MVYDVNQTTAYIREAARKRGIDPDTAVRVARSEGLGAGIWQSGFSKGGQREPSFGPFQLLVGGEGTNYPAGMGNDFKSRTGLDPSDPANVNSTIDFALDHAAQKGWGAWYGAAKAGVGNRDGIGGGYANGMAAAPIDTSNGASRAIDAAAPQQNRGPDMSLRQAMMDRQGGAPQLSAAPRPMIQIGQEKNSDLEKAMLAQAMQQGSKSKNVWDTLGGLAQVWASESKIKDNDKSNAATLESALSGSGLSPEYQAIAQLGGTRGDLANAMMAQRQAQTQQDERDYKHGQDATANSRADRTLTLQEGLANRKAEGFKMLTPEETSARGLPDGSYQVSPDGKIDPIGNGKGQSINVNTGANEGEFAKKAAGKMADRFDTISQGGMAATGVLQALPQMRELLTVAPQGPIQGRLAETFPGFNSAADAFGATVNQIAPTLRVPGSGAQSDKDMDLLMGSFPRLRNDPAANTVILDAFETKARINTQRAEIANAALRGELSPADADRRMGELDRTSIIPEGMRQRMGVTKPPQSGIQPSGGRPRATNQQTGEAIEFDGQQWVPAK